MKSITSPAKLALEDFNLFYEELPVENKAARLVEGSRIRRPSRLTG